jgi:hypothetical protein
MTRELCRVADFAAGQLADRAHTNDPDVARLLEALHVRYGDHIAAVLLYGSYLRGKRDTLLDFYVLLNGFAGALPGAAQVLGNRLLPPNVYYLSLPEGNHRGQHRPAVRAKYATLSLAQFERGMDDFHCYFWARFVQPAGLIFVRDVATRERVAAAVGGAVHAFVKRVAPLLPDPFPADTLWRTGFALTYACELRSEHPSGIAALYEHYQAYFDDLLSAYAAQPGAAVVAEAGGGFALSATGDHPGRHLRRTRLGWSTRRAQGKVLSILRLIKAVGTFDDPLDYLLWKLERHSGVYIAPTERQRRYPLIFAWGLLWRLYRRGAFR